MGSKRHYKEIRKYLDEWKWKHSLPKLLERSKSGAKGEIYSSKYYITLKNKKDPKSTIWPHSLRSWKMNK